MEPLKKLQSEPTRKQIFTRFYETHWWGDYETVSGAGSTLMATRNLRESLQRFLSCGMCKSILDVGCGDFHWMATADLSGAAYTGIDIVEPLIAENIRKYARDGIAFKAMDIVESVPSAHDLVLCKDLLSHLPLHEIVMAFNHIKQSGSTYFAATSFYPEMAKPRLVDRYRQGMNTEETTGRWRATNLRLFPFHFRAPLWAIPENEPGKSLDIWALDDLPFLDAGSVLSGRRHNPSTLEDFKAYRFFHQLCALPFIQEIALFGSRMHGTHKPQSDVDLMVYCDADAGDAQWLQVCEIIQNADLPLHIECSRYNPSLSFFMIKPEEYKDMCLYRRDQHA